MKSKELRKLLIDSIQKVQNGDLTPADGRNVVGMANQINISVQTELKKARLDIDTGAQVQKIGEMSLT